MTITLRKIHRYTWFAFAFLLPLGWLAAILALPETVWQSPVYLGQPPQLPNLLQSKESGDFVLNLRQDSTEQLKQIEIFIKKPQVNPSTVVIIETIDPIKGKKEQPLGLLGSRGVWRFNLDSLTAKYPDFKIRLDDNIQHLPLRSITFER